MPTSKPSSWNNSTTRAASFASSWSRAAPNASSMPYVSDASSSMIKRRLWSRTSRLRPSGPTRSWSSRNPSGRMRNRIV